MSIVSHPANKNYRDNFDAVFGKKRLRPRTDTDLETDMSVLDADGFIKPHTWEEPHDVPGQSTCWLCLYDRDHEIHTEKL